MAEEEQEYRARSLDFCVPLRRFNSCNRRTASWPARKLLTVYFHWDRTRGTIFLGGRCLMLVMNWAQLLKKIL